MYIDEGALKKGNEGERRVDVLINFRTVILYASYYAAPSPPFAGVARDRFAFRIGRCSFIYIMPLVHIYTWKISGKNILSEAAVVSKHQMVPR